MKMKTLIMLTMVFNLLNCEKEKDDKLNLVQQDFNGDQLRIDGFYYTEKESYDGIIYSRYALYKNGIIRYLGAPLDIDKIFNSGNYKTDWGIFNIENNNIQFERWYPSSGGPLETYVRAGIILNDTTFHITESYRLLNGEKTQYRLKDEIYHFKQFSPKPDSTNQFIE